ncbi:MAG: zinc ribbon domain-containing protein [Gemmatimonadota bacterium]|nr:zinc ribbon domain-containing protein [Gemmatimonadota bacterium]
MTAVYVFGAILAALLVAVVVAPLVERRRMDDANDPELTPERRKQRALDALRELEFEYETGKIPEDDYHTLRARYAQEAVAARDALGSPEPAPAPGSCGTCGAVVKAGAKFCSRCGEPVAAAAGG